MTKETVISVNNLSLNFANKKALDNVSFEAYKGEIIGILGPNGSGKSTLFSCIQGINEYYEGSSKIYGQESKECSPEFLAKIGVQMQSTSHFSKISVRNLFKFTANIHYLSISDAEIQDILDKNQLSDCINKEYDKLSGGQKQKINIALAVLHNPDILFLDEPTLGLDVHARNDLWEIIKSFKAQGKTVILTTHYMDEVENICDRSIVLQEGKLILDAYVKELFSALPYHQKIYFDCSLASQAVLKEKFNLDFSQLEASLNNYFAGEIKTQIYKDNFYIFTNNFLAINTFISDSIKEDPFHLPGYTCQSISLTDIFIKVTEGGFSYA